MCWPRAERAGPAARRAERRFAGTPKKSGPRQASQEALNALFLASPAPPPANGISPIMCCIFWVLNTIPLRSKLTANALLHSPAMLGSVVSLKHSGGSAHGLTRLFSVSVFAHAYRKKPPRPGRKKCVLFCTPALLTAACPVWASKTQGTQGPLRRRPRPASGGPPPAPESGPPAESRRFQGSCPRRQSHS